MISGSSRIEFNSGGFLGGMVRSGIRNYGKMQDMFPAQASGSYELNKTSEYLDFLTSNSYQDDIVPNLIQNDAAAILNNSKDMNMTPTQAVDIAEKAVKASIPVKSDMF